MKQNIQNLSENEKKVLISLLENSGKTDAQIAEESELSKSTVYRIRTKLESELISEYIPIIELSEIGIEVFVVLMFKWNKFGDEELTEEIFSNWRKNPRVIFLANGQGSSGLSTVLFLGFEDLEQYNEYFKEFRRKYDNYVSNLNSIFLPSNDVIKHDFTHIIKHVLSGG